MRDHDPVTRSETDLPGDLPGVAYDGLLVVEPRAGASSLTLSGEVSISGPLRLLEPLMRRRMRAGVRHEVAAIKANLEAADPGSRSGPS
ncbi:MAG: hypothetical protein R2737_05705 [Candidatus Nanopelagicales bacterium]